LRYLLIHIWFFFSIHTSFAQINLLIVSGQAAKKISAIEKDDILYIPLIEFAKATNTNYYKSDLTGKTELKFSNNLFKASPQNPFLIITERTNGTSRVYQLPTTTYVYKNEIFIPLIPSLTALERAFGNQLTFQEPNKLIIGEPSPDEVKELPDEDSELPPSTGFQITGVTVDEKANGTLITVHSSKRIPSFFSSFKDGVLSIIFRKVNADYKKTDKEEVGSLVRKIETKNIGEDTEFRFTVSEDYSTNEVMNKPESNDILITIHNKLFSRSGETTKLSSKWEFNTIVIDAGHGGKDPGAIGVNNVKEKDINLGVALKLGKIIEKEMPDVKVVYTRKTDEFLDLYKRGKIANEQNGNLFISIHCNATKKKPSDINGIEVYLLRPGRTQEAIEIAERENSVIQYEENPGRYEKLTDENFILVSMAHSTYMKYSEKFSEHLNKEFINNLKLNSRGVKQAGFYVLVGASMPSVLIESGFITNKNDAAFLKSNSGQQKLAESIFSAVKTYRSYYEKEMEAGL
jgi:N-acetylmuramoyl-L-alanine amidase